MRRATLGWLVLMACGAPAGAGGQEWRPGSAIELIRRAAAHRAARDADTLLATWQAEAHGFLRFASMLDHGDGPVERVIRLDELRVEVYGEAPNRSKQIIAAWRDTTFLPNRMTYHRDHLGIVTNDFGPIIRLGQGDEVRDVTHPLSEAGLDRYLFALGDTLTLASAAGTVRVVAVAVRPVDPDSAGTVGTLYLDIDRAALVRFSFTFTPASYRDPTVSEIAVTLDNSLQRQSRWLPWKQSIVIRRGLTAFDLPFRTVIRADWTIDDYRFGLPQPPERFAGPLVAGPLRPSAGGRWDAPIGVAMDGLPATDADLARIELQASEALGGRMLDGLPAVRLSGRGVSDFVRINRVEGVAPAAGLRFGREDVLGGEARVGIGLADRRVTGLLELHHGTERNRWSVSASRTMQDVGDVPVISGIANSVGTLISGDDHGDYALVESLGIAHSMRAGDLSVRLAAGREWSWTVANAFTPLSGASAANPPLGGGASWTARATLSRRDLRGAGWMLDAESGERVQPWYRARVTTEMHLVAPAGSLQLRLAAGAAWGDLPPDRTFVLGGRGTLLGVPFRSLGGTRMALAEAWWAFPATIPTPPLPYSGWVRLPSAAGPYLAAGIAGGDIAALPWRGTARIEPVAGLRLDLWGPLLRIDTGISLRTGRVAISVDAHPDWWPVL